MNLPKQFIVAGIGTEIGKTVVSAILVEALQADYWKPVQSGAREDSDTETVRQLISNSRSQFHPEAYQLTEPLSPHAAAALDDITIDLDQIRLPETNNGLIVELAGGLMVPLTDQELNIDLVQRLNLPVVLVSQNYLGSINHTLLSVEALRQRNIPLAGLIFNGPTIPSTETLILTYTNVPCLGRIGQMADVTKDTIAAQAKVIQSTFKPGFTSKPSPKSLAERDQAVIWKPFTQMQTAPVPIPIVRGEGAVLYSADGRQYIDAIASWWVNLHGHAHPYIAERVAEQARLLEHVIFADFTHEPAVALAERLLTILPDNQARIFYSDNGSTAVEVALKMAFQYWHNLGKPRLKVVAFDNAYHGDTFGAMAVGGRSAFTAPFVPFLFDVLYLPVPTPGQEETVLTLAEQLFTDEIAAFIVEPLVQGSGGMVMYEPAVLEQLMQLAHRNDTLVIADEVMTGFGRTGRLFASQYLTTEQPDLMCLSKGLTGGTMALGVTSCTQAIYAAFLSTDKFKTLFHGHSFTANPLACTAALASFDLLMNADTQADIRRISGRHTAFARQLSAYPTATKVRQRGTLLAFDLNVGETSYFNSIRDQAYHFLLDRGILMRPLGNVLYLMPPYCTTDAQITYIYEQIIALLNQLSA